MPEGMTSEQRMRYSRHTLLPEVGVEGQLKMLNAKVLLVGAGGLGSPPPSTWPPPGSARSAWSTTTRSTSRTCSAR